jgi:hypothetical protein
VAVAHQAARLPALELPVVGAAHELHIQILVEVCLRLRHLELDKQGVNDVARAAAALEDAGAMKAPTPRGLRFSDRSEAPDEQQLALCFAFKSWSWERSRVFDSTNQ